MPLFEFTLRPLLEIHPWGPPNDPNLHWFGLSDGWYSMAVGNERLFEYAPAMLEHYRTSWPTAGQPYPWADYQVIRLYEDLFEILPFVMRPIPDDQWPLIASLQQQHTWITLCQSAIETIEPNEPERSRRWSVYETATSWWKEHCLSTMHLRAGPEITFLRYGDDVLIRWSTIGCQIDGIQPWTATQGEHRMPLQAFRQEVREFHDSFMAAMTERIQSLLHNNPIPKVRIDFDALQFEHTQRSRWVDPETTFLPELPDSQEISKAIAEMRSWL